MDCVKSLIDDICESAFLQATAVVLVFIIILLWLFRRKRGKLPQDALIKLREERLAQEATPVQKSSVIVETPESRALLAKLRDAVVKLDPERLSKLEFRESNDTRIDNKQIVYLCLRDPATNELYSWNTVVYACIHEMAHAISVGYDPMHTSMEFQSNFWKLLRRAEAAGIYKPADLFPDQYCALPIDKNDPGLIIR